MRIESLTREHELDEFACGNNDLDHWLKEIAWSAHAGGTARVFVCVEGQRVLGYYALAAAEARAATLPARVSVGAPESVPLALMARLAVDLSEQGQGIGSALLMNALKRVARVSLEIGLRGLLVHAKEERGADWYRRFDFDPSPTDSLHLVLLLKSIRRAIE